MRSYTETIELLLRAKKENIKKEPSVSEKEQFMEAWKGFVMESGFSKDAEEFLYDGFSFCGAEPFYWYLNQSDEKNNLLNQLFCGRLYGKDSNATFRVLAHLFALLLNGGTAPNVLEPVIRHFPSACVNKKGNKLGTAVKTMEKYFFNVLSPSVDFVPLSEIIRDSSVMRAFASRMSVLIDDIRKIKTIKEPTRTNIEKMAVWTRGYPDATGRAEEGKDTSVLPGGIHTADACEALQNLLEQAKTLSKDIEKERVSQRNHIQELEKRIQEGEHRLSQSDEKNKVYESAMQKLNGKVYELEQQCNLLRQTIAEKDATITDKEKDIKDYMELSEALSLNQSKQADEHFQRIASKIRIEYRDFIDALNVEMTLDLGENLRLQLISIFDILEKSGMKIR